MEKLNKNYLVYGGMFIISIFVVLGLSFFINPLGQDASRSITGNSILTKSKMTEFDIQLARKLMDKDNDGKCDFCGMDVDLCIDAGMMECTMDSEAKIGLLGSEHIHADFKVYLNDEQINFNDKKYFVKSAFAHVEQEENNEETGNLLHIHAKGVPLWLFFESLGMKFNSPKLFVNGEEKDLDTYVPKSLDKILVTMSNDDKIKQELDSITAYAGSH